jgi:coenzyme F420-reducing hydrogenase gamma subunit/NAD(P)H-flavin reductase
MLGSTEAVGPEVGPMVPQPFVVAAKRRETVDTWTLELQPSGGEGLAFAPGQFTMLSAFGVGEVPISISGDPNASGPLVHTVRSVGLATEAICAAPVGEVLGVRGPFGRPWPVAEIAGSDVLVVAGGIGLAPLRPAILALLADRERYGRIVLLYGGRAPDQLLYPGELERWSELGLDAAVTVDSAGPEWLGHVGVVPRLVRRAGVEAGACCGAALRARGDDALHGLRARRARRGQRARVRVDGAQHAVRHRALRALPARTHAGVPRRAGLPVERARAVAGDQGAVMSTPRRQTLAVWKFASCDGCQLSLLDCEDELLLLADRLQIAYFLEATSATVEGPYDISIVEGSITTAHDAERIQEVRRSSRALITIGACATAGGIQALRNFADVQDFTQIVYAEPDYISTLATSTPISAHVPVDFELHGCPINKHQLLEVIAAQLARRRPRVRAHSVCVECKRRGTVCVMVAHGTPCLGPVTHAGCGAICPAYDRGCYGCYGPMEAPNTAALSREMSRQGSDEVDLVRVYRTFNADAEPFRRASEAHERG